MLAAPRAPFLRHFDQGLAFGHLQDELYLEPPLREEGLDLRKDAIHLRCGCRKVRAKQRLKVDELLRSSISVRPFCHSNPCIQPAARGLQETSGLGGAPGQNRE